MHQLLQQQQKRQLKRLCFWSYAMLDPQSWPLWLVLNRRLYRLCLIFAPGQNKKLEKCWSIMNQPWDIPWDGMGYPPLSPFLAPSRLRPLDLSFVSSWHLLIRLAMRALQVICCSFGSDQVVTFGWPFDDKNWFQGVLIDDVIVLFRYLWQNFVYFVAAIAYVAAVAACGRSPPKAEWLKCSMSSRKHKLSAQKTGWTRDTDMDDHQISSDFLELPFWSSLSSWSCALHIWRCL